MLEPPRGTETILLVEDEPLALELAQCTLQQLGYEVLACACADDALAELAEHERHIDLLLTDVVMPRINGKELAERLAPLQPDMKVLYTSGYGESIIATHGILDAEVNFIGKPYTPTALGHKVREVLAAVEQPRNAAALATGDVKAAG